MLIELVQCNLAIVLIKEDTSNLKMVHLSVLDPSMSEYDPLFLHQIQGQITVNK